MSGNRHETTLPHTRSAGFTLIEVLIVLVIVAIVTAIAVIAFGHFGRSRREKIIAEQFARTIGVAQQQAIFTPTVIGLGITTTGYRYFNYQVSLPSKKPEWVPIENGALSHSTAFEHVFDANVKNMDAFSMGKKSEITAPSIVFLPNGYVTPFELVLHGSAHHFVITVKNNGVVSTVVGSANEK